MILEQQLLDVRGLLSFRGKVKQDGLPEIMKSMKEYVEAQGVRVTDGPISVTYAVEASPEGMVSDTEILLPISGKVEANGTFAWKERLYITNAVKLMYAGTPELFQAACEEMNAYVQEKQYVPITAGYVVTKGIDQLTGLISMEVYMGISPNIL